MSDMTDAAASQMETMATRAATSSAQQSVRSTVAITGKSARISTHVAQGTVGGTMRALLAMMAAARQAAGRNKDTGQVGLKQFTRITDGKREILPVDERAVAREFARELRRHGVTFAIERHKDGSRTFHVEGKDASIVEHALSVAAARVDERIGRSAKDQDDATQDKQAEAEAEDQEVEVELNQQEAEQVSETLAEEHPELASQVTRDYRIVLNPVNVAAIDATATAASFEMLPDVIKDRIIAERATDLSQAAAQHVELPELDPEAEVILQLDKRERDSLVSALRKSVEPETMTLTPAVQSDMTATLRQHADSIAAEAIDGTEATPAWHVDDQARAAGHRYDRTNELADRIEGLTAENGDPKLTLDVETVQSLRDAYDAQGKLDDLAHIDPRLTDESLGSRSADRGTLAEQIENEGQVALTPDSVATLHETFGEDVWTQADNQHMSWVVGSVNQQHEARAVLRVAGWEHSNPYLDVQPDQPIGESLENPYLTAEPASRETAATAHGAGTDESPFGPDDWDGHEPHAQAQTPARTIEPHTTKAAAPVPDQGPANEREQQTAAGRDRQLSKRDATRERVSEKIETKADSIKKERGVGQTRTRATPRHPKVSR